MTDGRRRRALALAVAFLAIPFTVEAQQTGTGRIPRLGFLCPTQCPGHPLNEKVVLPALRDHGWIDGHNIVIVYRNADGHAERLPELAAELVALKVDLLVAPSQSAAEVLKRATTTIPIVFGGIAIDPVETGLVASLARPGGNMTGTTLLSDAQVEAKRLEVLKRAVPRVSRVAVLWEPGDPYARRAMLSLESAARLLGIKLVPVEFRGVEQLETSFSMMKTDRADALYVMPTPVTFRHMGRIMALAAQARLPAISWSRQFAEAGALLAYGPDIADSYRRAVTFIDRILKGASPAELPVEQPTKYELVINLRTAKTLGLTIPPSVLLQAEAVIE